MVSSLLRPDGTVQTTSQVTLDQFPSFINGNEVQLFFQTHGLVHLRNVQTHSSSRNIRAMQDQTSDVRSRSRVPRRSCVRLTPGPHGHSEDEDDWGEWTHCRTYEDCRRPRSPSIPPVRQVASTTVDLIHLPVRASVPSPIVLCFALGVGLRKLPYDDVLYYTLPCIAELVFPDPSKWKKSWETVYRSLMPHRHNIVQDEDRVRSVSELPAMRPPHGNPGAWATEVINEIAGVQHLG